MRGSGLIADYLAQLSRQLPAPLAEELADGLDETYHRYLGLGLPPEAAAEAAVAEFGDPELIAAEFTRAHPVRRAARALLRIGPLVGACWVVALVTGRAWTWPVPLTAGLVPGTALVIAVVLLGVAARTTRYRPAARAGMAGCVGTVALDASMIIGVLVADPAVRSAAVVAMAASAARLGFSARLLLASRRDPVAGNTF